MTSYQALHRQAARRARRDQIRREVHEAVEQLALLEAGDPVALARHEEALREYVEPGPEMLEQRPRRVSVRRGRVRWSWRRFWRFEREPRRYFGHAYDEADYPAPEPFDSKCERYLQAVAAGEEPGRFGMTPEWAAELLAAGMRIESDREPSWLRRFGESDRAYRRRCWGQEYRAARPMHRRALLLARGWWDAGHELPEPLRRILLGEERAIRAELSSPRALERIALGKTYRVTEQAPSWAASPTVRAPFSVPGAIHALYARRSETWALVRGPGWSRTTPAGAVVLAVLTGAVGIPP